MRQHTRTTLAAALIAAGLGLAIAVQAQDKPAAHHGGTSSEPGAKQHEEMGKRMQAMHEQMERIHKSTDPKEREKLMREHFESMQQGMGAMRGTGGGMMGMHGGMKGGQGMGMGRGSQAPSQCAKLKDPADRRTCFLEDRVDMMQFMMDHMMQREQMRQAPR